TELRVCNVIWTGDWPREIPSLDDQELVLDETGFLDERLPELTAVFSHDFPDKGLPLDRFAVIRGNPEHLVSGPEGLRAWRQAEGGYRNASVSPILQVGGDFDIAGMRVALSIAGSDPTGGAGPQQDLQVFRALGVHGAGVVTALTVQDTQKVHRVLPAFPSVVSDQLRALLADVVPAAVKLGMLASDDVLRAVALGLETLPEPRPLVIDPVLRASDGTLLLERRAWPGLLDLMRGATLVTPNLPEAEELTSCDVSTRRGVERAARWLLDETGAGAVLVKGGHRDGAPDDCFAEREEDGVAISWLPGERIEGAPVHGTGCALSAAIAAALARGEALERAVATGRAFVREAIARAEAVGGGARVLGLG
ncbi:MAG: bifunctional hydroxymethylpyrimidine kinase/phosphomethylpyrimidine kinase, partial [Myxococcota bacterium]